MANEMRDRLINSIETARDDWWEKAGHKQTSKASADYIADCLLDDGWVRLPCKVGDTVYFPNEGYHDSAEIERIYIDENGVSFAWVQYDYGPDIVEVWDDGEFSIDEIGKTVFLTIEAKAEAEQKLKEMRGE